MLKQISYRTFIKYFLPWVKNSLFLVREFVCQDCYAMHNSSIDDEKKITPTLPRVNFPNYFLTLYLERYRDATV